MPAFPVFMFSTIVLYIFSLTCYTHSPVICSCIWFLCVFVAAKVPITFIVSVDSPVHVYQRSFHWTDFCEIWHRRLLWKSVKKTQIWLKSGRNICHFTWRPKYSLLFPVTLNCHKSTLFKWNCMMWDDMLYLLTAIRLTPSESSTVHIYTQTIHRTTQLTRTIHRTTQLTNWGAINYWYQDLRIAKEA